MSRLELKIPPVALWLLMAGLMWLLSRYAAGMNYALPGHKIAAWVLMVAGAVVCGAGVVSFRRARTTVNPLKPESASALVVSGIYRVTRNPMYLGMLLILAGWALLLSHALTFLGLPGFFLYMNRFQISPEERALGTLFGGQFDSYCARVRRWL